MNVRKILFSVFITLFLFLSGWLWWRDYVSFQQPIPENASSVVKIHTDDLIWEAIKYTITHPSQWGGKKDTTKRDKEKRGNGIEIPAHFFIYTLPEKPGELFTQVPVVDSADAKVFFANYLQLDSYASEGSQWKAISGNRLFSVSITEDFASISYSPPNVPKERSSGERQREGLKLMSDSLKTIVSNAPGNLAFITQGLELGFDLSGNSIEISGNINKGLTMEDLPFLPFVSLQGEDLPIKSLLDSAERIQIWVEGMIDKVDTIVSYEFNDDFEKVEKKELKNSRVPGIYIRMQGDFTDGMWDSLTQGMKKLGLNVLRRNDRGIWLSNNTEMENPTNKGSAFFTFQAAFPSFSEYFQSLPNENLIHSMNNVVFTMNRTESSFTLDGEVTLSEHLMELINRQ